MQHTTLVSLLQPAPETYDLFDDIMLISSGKLVFHCPREFVLPFYESLGFACPKMKGVADFLQEVNTFTDQEVRMRGCLALWVGPAVSAAGGAAAVPRRASCMLGILQLRSVHSSIIWTAFGIESITCCVQNELFCQLEIKSSKVMLGRTHLPIT